jgi:hypothetical protein
LNTPAVENGTRLNPLAGCAGGPSVFDLWAFDSESPPCMECLLACYYMSQRGRHAFLLRVARYGPIRRSRCAWNRVEDSFVSRTVRVISPANHSDTERLAGHHGVLMAFN